MVDEVLAGAVLTIDLDALAGNYRQLRNEAAAAACGAVLKADAYGTGADRVGPVLFAEGARDFFVAHIDEGIRLRAALADAFPGQADAAVVHILGGLLPGSEDAFTEHRLTPVLNGLDDVARWRAWCADRDAPLPCDLHVDTGMCRLGLDRREFEAVRDDPSLLDGLAIDLMMSHLASGDDKASPQNAKQLNAYLEARRHLTMGRASLANSPGLFLGPDYHFDLVRPGYALYGGNPTTWRLPEHPNPMAQVVHLQAKILQVRSVDTPDTVGYGASHKVTRPSRIATLPVGYADGYLRSLSSRAPSHEDKGHFARAHIGETGVPIVGRVSMDLITIDVTDVPEAQCRPGQLVDLIGPRHTVEDLAAEAGTIGYEILTSLGDRYHRVYKGGGLRP